MFNSMNRWRFGIPRKVKYNLSKLYSSEIIEVIYSKLVAGVSGYNKYIGLLTILIVFFGHGRDWVSSTCSIQFSSFSDAIHWYFVTHLLYNLFIFLSQYELYLPNSSRHLTLETFQACPSHRHKHKQNDPEAQSFTAKIWSSVIEVVVYSIKIA